MARLRTELVTRAGGYVAGRSGIWGLTAKPELKVRWFEPEAFTARATDIMLCETKDLSAWAWICDHLRDTPFWDHYFEVLDILASLEGNCLSQG